MKKKFFTLLAAAAFCSFGVVQAADIELGNKHTSALKQGGLYHVGATDGKYLYLKGDTVQWGKVDSTNLSASLWCVNAEIPSGATYPEFAFENKKNGFALGVDLTKYYASGDRAFEAILGTSDATTWRFSGTYKTQMDATANYLMAYVSPDSIAVLTNSGDSVFVELVKAPAVGVAPATTRTLIQAFLYDAAPIVLTAEMFNTMLGSELSAARALKYIDPKIGELESSPFTEKLSAESTFVNGNSPSAGYVCLKIGDEYLRVDTMVYNVGGNPYLKFAKSKATEIPTGSTSTAVNIRRLHYFRLTYLPSADSLIINVRGAYIPEKGDDLSDYSTWAWHLSDDTDPNRAAQDKTAATDSTYLVIQNLTETEYCLTIGQMPIQLHVGLGFGGCEVPDDNRATLQGLYTIKNAKGQYLQVPIYTDSTTTPVPEWVTVNTDIVNPERMPSFHWVVQKDLTSPRASKTSPVTIINREHPVVRVASVQFYTNAVAKPDLFGLGVDVSLNSFKPVPKELREDPYLGYKYVGKIETEVTTYTFNYLHNYADNKYLSVKNDDKDSILYAQNDKDAFTLIPYPRKHSVKTDSLIYDPVVYGWAPESWATGDNKIAQLVRSTYVLKVTEGTKLKNTNKIVVVDDEEMYSVTGDVKNDSAVFYFKTNNTVNGKDYHALIDTASLAKDVKAGVYDDYTWVRAQNMRELRTSAFLIEPNEEPLYRRFNRADKDGAAVGSDSFYSADADMDAPLVLRFSRANNGNEYLYEDSASTPYSERKGIHFLGVRHKTDFGISDDSLAKRTSFYVDTAYVNRPAVSGLNFDTPKPQYLLAVGVKIYSDTIMPQGECEPEIVAEGYTRGRYLINATDSVYGVDSNWKSNAVVDKTTGAIDKTVSVKNDKYIWNTKWERLAFVDAIHKGDTLYILNGQKYNDPIQNFTALNDDPKVEKVYLGNNKHKDEVFSFRLIESEKNLPYVSQAQKFLIESETEHRGIDPMIAPMNGGWVKIQNGVPVISRGFYEQAITDAEIFQVESSSVNPSATPNEDINVTAVKVVAGNGNVTILNAAGKTVTISNILGQTVANTTISSDNVTIAAPKGIVVVAVQGEDAVKAIVK